jgi:amino acid transporter
LGVIIGRTGPWAWLSFLLAGLIALASAHSYSQLSLEYRESGGAYTFLRKAGKQGLAASLAWVLVLGYVLTIAVYAHTFGHYVANVFKLGSWFPGVLAFVVIGFLALINLRGVGDASRLEIITVWGKLAVLLGLALFGLAHWAPAQLSAGIEPKSWDRAIIGAATIFMAYEGFQLLSYDFDDIKNAGKTLPRAMLSAVVAVLFIYILVALGATMLVGASQLVEQKEIALAIAGQKALGTPGLVLITIAAAFSTGSAINATLFSTARLVERAAVQKDLPALLKQENRQHIPRYAILGIAGLAAVLAIIGSLGVLVDAASLVFLVTFGTVNLLAWRQNIRFKAFALIGLLGSVAAIILSVFEQFRTAPVPVSVVIGLILLSVVAQPFAAKLMKR